MPFGVPSFNSVRVQRAYRMNQLEGARLQYRVRLLDKERAHSARLVKQDVRMINLTLEHIQTSSGNSPEGLAPDARPDNDDKAEETPYFMYGERVKTPMKSRRQRRALSAPNRRQVVRKLEPEPEPEDSSDSSSVISSSRSSTSLSSSSFSLKQRPQTSFASYPHQKGHEESFKLERFGTPKQETVTGRRTPAISRPTSRMSHKGCMDYADMSMQRPNSRQLKEQTGEENDAASDGRRTPHVRNSGIASSVNQARVQAQNAKKMRSMTPYQAWAMPASTTQKQQQNKDKLKTIDQERRGRLENKLRSFLTQHPMHRAGNVSTE